MGTWRIHDYVFPLVQSGTGMVGCGTMISENGWFVTARHVLEAADTAPLTFGDGRWFASYEIDEKEFHISADLGAGRFKLTGDEKRPFLPLYAGSAYPGDDVIGWGFTAVETDDLHLYHDTRLRKGYIQRSVEFDVGNGPFMAYGVVI